MQTSNRQKKKIFLYQTIIPHYRVPIWDRLNRILDGRLVVVYGEDNKASSHFIGDLFPFPTYKVSNYWMANGRIWIQPFFKPFKIYGTPELVISSQTPRCLSLFPLIVCCNLLKIPIILRGHGGSKRRNVFTSNCPADYIHRWLIRQSDAYVCYTDNSRDLLTAVTDPVKLFVGRNTLDTDSLFSLRRKLELQGKEQIRKQLGLTESSHYICFIGRLLKSKQVDLMLKALHMLQVSNSKIGAIIIGDGPQRRYLEQLTYRLKLKDVYFTGFLPQWERSAPYIYACDVLVNPGYVGLSVNHALSFGLPVITQKNGPRGPFHSPEVAFIKPGLTGFFAKYSDRYDLCRCIFQALKHIDTLSQECIKFAEKHLKVDIMVEGHMQAIRFVT